MTGSLSSANGVGNGPVRPDVRAFFHPATHTLSYIVSDPQTRRAAIIDPVLDFDPHSGGTTLASVEMLLAAIQQDGLRVEWLLETHVHADHVSAAYYLGAGLGGLTGIGEHVVEVQEAFGKLLNLGRDFARNGSQFDRLWSDGDTFELGAIGGRVLAVPGHTPDGVCYVFGDAAFVGDTLFMPDAGTARTDFPGGCARTLYGSLRRILALPAETRLFMCHDYGADGERDVAWESTVGEQRRSNIHCRDGISCEDFVTMREARDAKLSAPELLWPAVQINIRGGRMPAPESNGRTYLKVPVEVLL